MVLMPASLMLAIPAGQEEGAACVKKQGGPGQPAAQLRGGWVRGEGEGCVSASLALQPASEGSQSNARIPLPCRLGPTPQQQPIT